MDVMAVQNNPLIEDDRLLDINYLLWQNLSLATTLFSFSLNTHSYY